MIVNILTTLAAPLKDIKNLLERNCYTVSFYEESNFDGERDLYEGVLIKKGDSIEIVYFTSPPFVIKADKERITLGYLGQESQTYDREEYKNPILEVLLNLNELDRYFKLVSRFGDTYLYRPKGELKDYIDTLQVRFKRGLPQQLEVSGGPDNYAVIRIGEIKPTCGPIKLESLNGKEAKALRR